MGAVEAITTAASVAHGTAGNVVKAATGDSAMSNVAGAAMGIGAGVYLVRVGLAGNAPQLFQLLSEEGGYLQVLVALYALYLLYEFGPAPELIKQLYIAAAIGVALTVVKNNDTIITDLQQFGKDKDLGALAKKLFGG